MTSCPRCGARLVREGSDVECQNGCDLNAPDDDYSDENYSGPRGREAEYESRHQQEAARRLK